MRLLYGKQDMATLGRAQENCWLLPNGLGGYASMTAAFSATRGDHGLLISAEVAPSLRNHLVHGISEVLCTEGKRYLLSTQEFADRRRNESGYKNLTAFVWDGAPSWVYEAEGFCVRRSCVMGREKNTTALLYQIENHSAEAGTLTLSPRFSCVPKGQPRKERCAVSWDGKAVCCGGFAVYLKANVPLMPKPTAWETLFYRADVPDGRTDRGLVFSCLTLSCRVEAGQRAELELILSDRPIEEDAHQLHDQHRKYLATLPTPFRNPIAQELARSADAYISRRDSTKGQTLLAGYPFFGDWGRDTMIALPGCTLSTGRWETAKNILQTFLAYERDGLVPNLFPEGNQPPQYNTVDAALLLINCVWLYYQKTKDRGFIQEAFPTLHRIIAAYVHGTAHGIGMDADGLIRAGQGLDQVTWMDVRVGEILPTPRHGKPVEINAYWYNALRIMEQLAPLVEEEGTYYGSLAKRTKQSFLKKFWVADKGYLKDVLSGTEEETQLRCNQIWAITLPFSMLPPEWERQVVEVVYRELYTPCGLRTLSPKDAAFHPTYGGEQKERDMAYHQGTVWVYPLGAYYRAYLKVHGYSREAGREVLERLECLYPMMREGCIGQLPEIYDGLNPTVSRGCFAQAWSVGELLTVYEELEKIETERD